MGVGKARGSMGNVTYRTVRGRTIGSQKRSSGDPATRADGETLVQFIFGLMARYAAARAADIAVSFSPTKYGSARNAFMKLNYEGFKQALSSLYQTGMKASYITDEVLNQTITEFATSNPTVIVRSKLDGQGTVYLDGEWAGVIVLQGSISSASFGGTSVANGASLPSGQAGKKVIATLVGFENVTLIEDGMFLEVQKDASSEKSVINCTGATVTQSGENFVVEATTSADITSGTYQFFRIAVRHNEGEGLLTSKIYSDVDFAAGGNPL